MGIKGMCLDSVGNVLACAGSSQIGPGSLVYVFSCKSLRRNIWEYNPFSNKHLNRAVFFGLVLLVLTVYVPPFTHLLKTVPLSLFDWSLILGLGFLNIAGIEAAKWYYIKRQNKTKR
ncbi:cation transporting ATPase C-terminal domain-containing protein [PVC group bacterium]|nr:cation transporting ATPase C-terminal domain-containing protein [PVC group bacterium]